MTGISHDQLGYTAKMHRHVVSSRRARVLADLMYPLLGNEGSVLDVGCGYGLVGHTLQAKLPNTAYKGIDIDIPADCLIEAATFDGTNIPYEDKSFDYVILTDVLHHTSDPNILLAEAVRTASRAVILKDHLLEGFLAGPVLRFLDWGGNRPYGVGLTYNYWTRGQWREAFETFYLVEDHRIEDLGLYAWPFSLVFDRSLHFISRLVRRG